MAKVSKRHAENIKSIRLNMKIFFSDNKGHLDVES
jgi:hypothetical protein